MIGVNNLLFPLFLGCIVSPVWIYLFCFSTFSHLRWILLFSKNNKTKKKKKLKNSPDNLFILLHHIQFVGLKNDGGMGNFIYRKISNAQAETKFFFFFYYYIFQKVSFL
jgi:hypothetical protein